MINIYYIYLLQEPNRINCKSLSKYPYNVRYPSITSDRKTVTANSIKIYADANQQITVSVWARNNENFVSKPTTKTITTPMLGKCRLVKEL